MVVFWTQPYSSYWPVPVFSELMCALSNPLFAGKAGAESEATVIGEDNQEGLISDPDNASSPGNLREEEVPAWVGRTLARLGHSNFRAGFSLSAKDRSYARARGKATINRHAHEMLAKRVGPAHPLKDGKQTPYRGHPVFTAQHATGTCCRGCIQRWHHIPKGRPLTDREIDRLAALVMGWIERDLMHHPA